MAIEELSIPAKSETVSELVTTASAFAYATLAPDLAKAAQAAAARIKAKCRDGQAIIFEIGQELLALKGKLQHGEFGKWIAAEFDWTERTAQNYMNAARLYQESETVSVLPPKVVYALAAPGVPAETKNKVLAEIGKGVIPKAETVLTQINQAKRAAAAVKAQARREAMMTAEQKKQAEKKAKRSAAYRAKKAEEDASRQAAWEKEKQEQKRHAAVFVAMLKQHLGEKLSKAVEHFEGASYRELRETLRAATTKQMSQKAAAIEHAIAA